MSAPRRLVLGISSIALGATGLAAVGCVMLGWWPPSAAPASLALLLACEGIPVTTRAGVQRRVMLALLVAVALTAFAVSLRLGWIVALTVAFSTGTLRLWRRAAGRSSSSASTITRVTGLATLVLAGLVAFVLRVDDSTLVALFLTAVAAFLIADGPGWSVSLRW